MLYRAMKFADVLLSVFSRVVLLLLIALLIEPSLTRSTAYIWLSTQMSEVVRPRLLLLSSSITEKYMSLSFPEASSKTPTTSSSKDSETTY